MKQLLVSVLFLLCSNSVLEAALKVVAASSQRAECVGASVTTVPLTLSAWFNAANITSNQTLVGVFSNNGSYSYYLSAAGAESGDYVKAMTRVNTWSGAATTAGFTANEWHHAVAVYTTIISRTAYLDGANAGSDTTSMQPIDIANTIVGAYYGGAYAYSDCNIAEVGIWDVNLTATEVDQLYTGKYSPHLVSHANLVAYYPLGGGTYPDDLADVQVGYDLTGYGEPTYVDHPTGIVYTLPASNSSVYFRRRM